MTAVRQVSWRRSCRVPAVATVAAMILAVCVPLRDAGAQMRNAPDWSRYRDPQLGLSVDLPMNVFAPKQNDERSDAAMFATADDRARLQLFSFENRDNETPARHLRRIKNDGPARFTYERTTRRFFVASGLYEGKIFYRRCNFPVRAGRVACVEMRYPAVEKRAWDRIVTRISNSLRRGASN